MTSAVGMWQFDEEISMRLAGMGLVLFALALAWLLWPTAASPEPPFFEPLSSVEGETSSMTSGARAPISTSGFREDQGSQLPPGTAAGSKPALFITGRLIDSEGRPLPSGTVSTAAWLSGTWAQLPPSWTPPAPAITDGAGRFSIRAPTPEGFAITLTFRVADFVPRSGRWGEFGETGHLAVGDVVLHRGAQVAGALVDSIGAPQGNVRLLFARDSGPGTDELEDQRWQWATTSSDGRFVLDDALSAGLWKIHVIQRILIAPSTVEVPENLIVAPLTVTVQREDDVARISGKVVDESGAPIGGAYVRALLQGQASAPATVTASDAQGHFVIKRSGPSAPETLTLMATKDGHEGSPTPRKHAWGERDVVLPLLSGLRLDVRVVDDESGDPIEDFGVLCFLDPRFAGALRSSEYHLRAQGHHEGGIASITGLVSGKRLLSILPKDARWASTPFLDVELTRLEPTPRLDIRIPRAALCTLTVKRRGGGTIGGTRVELLRRWSDQRVTFATRGLPPEEIHDLGKREAPTVATGVTDAAGQCELVAPSREVLTLRILGPGHTPYIEDVSLAPGPSELERRVGSGASVIGLLSPAQALADIANGQEGRSGTTRSGACRVRLVRGTPETEVGPHTTPLVSVAADGGFSIEGVPPGTWDVHLVPPGHPEEVRVHAGESIGTISELKDGEVRRFACDVSSHVRGTLTGRVTLNGAPLTHSRVFFRGRREGNALQDRIFHPGGESDERGEFTARLAPGQWTCSFQIRHEQMLVELVDTEEISVLPGQTLQRTFALRSGPLTLRVLSPDGSTPRAGVNLVIKSVGWQFRPPPTDSTGLTTAPVVRESTVEIFALPRELIEANGELRFRGSWDPHLVPVGTMTFAGKATAIDLPLPESAGY